jgi:hypothetical protein
MNQFNVNFLDQLGSSDFESWILVQQAYRSHAFGEYIMECGFNTMTGKVYIALENGICIASCFGQEVEYIVDDNESGEELFFESYQEALDCDSESDECKECDECGGSGSALLYTNEGPESREYMGDCPECEGTGEIDPRNFFLNENE